MPTFTAIALDTLLEPGGSKSVDKSIPRPVPKPRLGPNSKLERRNSSSVAENKRPKRPPITPSLYATPEATPLPDSPTSFPPSPYIVNHKRRGPRLLKSSSETNIASRKKSQEGKEKASVDPVTSSVEKKDSATFENGEPTEEARVDDSRECGTSDGSIGDNEGGAGNGEAELGSGGVFNAWGGVQESPKRVPSTPERDSEREDFYDPQESMSFTSNTDVEDNNAEGERSALFATPMGEFFDAWEELSSEGGQQQSSVREIESEVREMRLSLLMEIEKRKQAEEALSNLRRKWQNIQHQLSLAGLTLPADPTAAIANDDLCQQVYLARFVANSVGRGLARAELEAEMAAQIEAKNLEIARLCDKLRNYEAMNQEMVQRNRDVLETARRERERKEKRQRWIWGSLAAALTIGAAGLAWSYLPSSSSSSSSYVSEVPESDDGAN